MASAIDNLRERWDRITPRERVMVIALGGTAAFLIVWFIATTISGGLDNIEHKNTRARRALSALHEYRVQQALGVANDDRPKVPIGKDKVNLESYLEQIGKQVGVEIPGYSPRPNSSNRQVRRGVNQDRAAGNRHPPARGDAAGDRDR